jgi:hypothetical protein
MILEQADSTSDLLSAASMIAVCELTNQISTSYTVDPHECGPRMYEAPDQPCCPSRTLGNYAAAYANKDCASLTEADALDFRATLERCAPSYYDGTLVLIECSNGCPSSIFDPTSCEYGNFVYDSLNALVREPPSQPGPKLHQQAAKRTPHRCHGQGRTLRAAHASPPPHPVPTTALCRSIRSGSTRPLTRALSPATLSS